MIFPVLLSLVACPTVFWWAWMDEWIRSLQPPTRAGGLRRSVPWIRASLAIYTAAVLAPILMMLVARRVFDAVPVPVLMWVMAWHLSVVLAGLVGLIIWLPWQMAKRLRTLPLVFAAGGREEPADQAQASPDEVNRQMSRRAFLAGAITCAPVLVSGSTVAAGLRQQGRFVVRRIEMCLPGLPERLRGLTITHLSDLHVGRLFRPEYLDRVVEVTGKLDSDLIAITGDTVDHSADFLPVACDAFQQMHSRYGRFVVIGNHDLIDSPRQAVDYLASRERRLLVDRCEMLEIGGERLRIAGLFWSRYDRARFGTPGHYERVAKVVPGGDRGPFTIALAHHPHAFDALADAGVDLTLAGHTHGGQLMATPPGSPYPIGGGNLLFRYIYGEYRRGEKAMYVNSGVGNWFPIRINAPAEVVQIRLV